MKEHPTKSKEKDQDDPQDEEYGDPVGESKEIVYEYPMGWMSWDRPYDSARDRD